MGCDIGAYIMLSDTVGDKFHAADSDKVEPKALTVLYPYSSIGQFRIPGLDPFIISPEIYERP